MKKIKHLSLFLGLALMSALYSCKKETIKPSDQAIPSEEKISVVNGRLKFQDRSTLIQFIKDLSVDTNIYKRKESLESKFLFSSLLDELNKENQTQEIAELDSLKLPHVISVLLNTNGELQFGDTIMWYNKGFCHYIPNESLLSQIKSDPSKSILKFPEGAQQVSRKGQASNPNARVSWVMYGGQAIDARYQKQFWTGRTEFKFVDAVFVDVKTWPDYSQTAYVYLDLNLEYWHRGWRTAGEARYYSGHVWGDVNSNGYDRYFSGTTAGRVQIFLNSHYTPNNGGMVVGVEVSGDVYQSGVGNDFYVSGYPLW